MSRYLDLQMKIKLRLKRENVLADLRRLAAYGKLVLIAFIVSLGILIIIAALPDKIFGYQLSSLSSGLVNGGKQYKWLLLALVITPTFFVAIRGTIRNVAFNISNAREKFVILFFTAVFLYGFSINPARFEAPNRPLLIKVIADVTLLTSGLLLMVLLTPTKKRELENAVLEADELLDDERRLSEDQQSVLQDLSQLIGQEEKLHSIGLFGDWGTGKTSIYNLMRKRLRERTDLLWLDFQPWKYTSQESLVLGFFGEIGQLIERSIPGKQNSLARLVEASEPIVRKHDDTGIFSTITSSFKTTLDGRKKPGAYIENILKKNSRRLIVVVDDAERGINEDQINRALQLVHELSRQTRVTYLFIADKEALLQCMPLRLIGQQRNEYIEKFIEHELHIPAPNDADLRSYLDALLSSRGDKIPEDFKINVRNSVIKDMHSYRGVLKVFDRFIWQLEERFYERSI